MPPMKQVWITGAGGLIGNHLVRAAAACVPRWQVHGTGRRDVDLTDADQVHEHLDRWKPDIVIHCAALGKPASCEQDPALAAALNVEATRRLCRLAHDIPLVFISSDLVFDGREGRYDESSPVNPLGVYAGTKVAAEEIVLANPRHTVIRTSLNAGTSPTGDRSFTETLRAAWQAGATVRLFTDEFRCPISAAVTARATWELTVMNKPGLYHLAGAERLSRWQIGELLAQRWVQLNPRLEPASRLGYGGPPRPADTSLNCAKVQALLSFALPRFTEWLAANPLDPL
jgi:dTDP-4-dehydrorhamnose reductase